MRTSDTKQLVGTRSIAKPRGAAELEKAAEKKVSTPMPASADGMDDPVNQPDFANRFSNDVDVGMLAPISLLREVGHEAPCGSANSASHKLLSELIKLADDKQSKEVVKRVHTMSKEDFQSFVDGLAPEEQMANGPFLQMLAIYRVAGKTVEELGEDQLKFVSEQAQAKGQTPGAYIRDLIKTSGYGGSSTEAWDKLSPAEKKQWQVRFDAAEAAVIAAAPADVKHVIERAKSHGGGFAFNPRECEKLGAFAYTSGDWTLHAGMPFVEQVEKNGPQSVFANTVHEIGGHNVYGKSNIGTTIMKGAVDRLDPKEKELALSGGNSLHSTYGYPETEVYAELYEWSYDGPKNPTDHPFAVDPQGNINVTPQSPRKADIPDKLKRIKNFFDPAAARAIVEGLALRVAIDDTILPKGKELFREQVKSIFGYEV